MRVRRSIIDMYDSRAERFCLRAEQGAWRKRGLKWAWRVLPWAARKRALPFAEAGDVRGAASGVKSVMPKEDIQEADGETRLESRGPV